MNIIALHMSERIPNVNRSVPQTKTETISEHEASRHMKKNTYRFHIIRTSATEKKPDAKKVNRTNIARSATISQARSIKTILEYIAKRNCIIFMHRVENICRHISGLQRVKHNKN